jgi:hypothetical protein
MVSRERERIALIAASCAPLWMCASAARHEPPSATPPPAAIAPSAADAPPAAPAPTEAAPRKESRDEVRVSPATESASEAQVSATNPGEAHRIGARREFDQARIDLEAAASDCSVACRALTSMERAVTHLCALTEEPDDRRRCDSAKKQLRDARTRVRQACGSCPGGPSVDRAAPIPSR